MIVCGTQRRWGTKSSTTRPEIWSSSLANSNGRDGASRAAASAARDDGSQPDSTRKGEHGAKPANELTGEERQKIFASKVDPKDPRLNQRGPKNPKSKNRRFEAGVAREQTEHGKNVKEFLKLGMEKGADPNVALQAALEFHKPSPRTCVHAAASFHNRRRVQG